MCLLSQQLSFYSDMEIFIICVQTFIVLFSGLAVIYLALKFGGKLLLELLYSPDKIISAIQCFITDVIIYRLTWDKTGLLDIHAPIIPHEGLGGIKLYSTEDELHRLLSSNGVTRETLADIDRNIAERLKKQKKQLLKKKKTHKRGAGAS